MVVRQFEIVRGNKTRVLSKSKYRGEEDLALADAKEIQVRTANLLERKPRDDKRMLWVECSMVVTGQQRERDADTPCGRQVISHLARPSSSDETERKHSFASRFKLVYIMSASHG